MFTLYYCKYITHAAAYEKQHAEQGWKPPWQGILLAAAESSNETQTS